jgi:hypothetical protein
LKAGIPIVPVLVDGAAMPERARVPESLWPLLTLNAVSLSSGVDFHGNADRLIVVIDAVLGAKAPAFSRVLPPLSAIARNPLSWLVLAVAAVPFLLGSLGVTPPWPPGVALETALFNSAVVVGAFLFLPRVARRVLSRLVVCAVITVVLAGTAFVAAESAFVYQTPATHERFVKGYVCSNDALLLYRAECPFLGNDRLQTAEYDADRLWTTQSIAIVQTMLLALWYAANFGAAFLCGVAFTQVAQGGSRAR